MPRDHIRGWLNGSVPTAVEQLGENRVRFTVDVSPDQVQHAVDHAMSDLSESVKIPGFRKGKIPTPVLVSRLGKDRIYAEAVDSHIGGWFWSAASRNRVRPVAEPQYEFELPDTADTSWSFTATVEVQALPEIADWTQLEVPRAEVEVPRESVDAELEALRESVAELAPATDRPARDGDTLVVDLVDPDGEAQRDTIVELGSGRLSPELEAVLGGASAGEAKEVALPRADGTSSTVEVIVREVQEKTLPELDDELARAASEFDTLEELTASIEGTLGSSSTRRSMRRSGRRRSTSSSALPRCSRRCRSSARGRPISSRASRVRWSAAASRSRRTWRRAVETLRSSSGRWCSRPLSPSRASSRSSLSPSKSGSR